MYNLHTDPVNFLEFIKYQRYNFFSKVENDYLEEPENETLQIFKPDINGTNEKAYFGIQKKLDQSNLTKKQKNEIWQDSVEGKNQKYNSIESLICDSSVVFSEDLKFLFEDDLNYLHLLIRSKGIEIASSKHKRGKEHSHSDDKKDQKDLIEIG